MTANASSTFIFTNKPLLEQKRTELLERLTGFEEKLFDL